MATKEPTTWGGNNQGVQWGDNIFTWNDVFVLRDVEQEFSGGVGGGIVFTTKKPAVEVEKKLGKEKAEKFARIVCKVNGIKYDEKKQVKDLKITVKHVKKTFAPMNIKVEILNEKFAQGEDMLVVDDETKTERQLNEEIESLKQVIAAKEAQLQKIRSES